MWHIHTMDYFPAMRKKGILPSVTVWMKLEGIMLSEISQTERQKLYEGFPGGTVVKNPPVNAGDTGSSPGPGRSRMPRSN